MPWGKSPTIPKFGNWDKKEDLSYSIVFDAARADKEQSMFMSYEDENDRALFQKMKKGLHGTSNLLDSYIDASDPIDSNLSSPYHHSPRIGNDIPKKEDGPGLKEFSNGDPINGLKIKRPENHGQSLDESHHRKVQGISNQSRVQEKPATKKVQSDNILVPRFGNWDISDDSSKGDFTVIFERAMDEKKLKSGDMAAFRNMSPLTIPQKDLHINSNGAKIYKRRRVFCFGCLAGSP